jgi:hypothetical protein
MAKSDDITAQLLSREDRESGLVLDAEGQWRHEGGVVEHQRLAAALHRWLDVDPDTGRYVVRAGEQWCFVTVEDAPYMVRTIALQGAGQDLLVHLRLSDGSVEELNYGSLRQNEQHIMYCQVKGGRFPARFSRPAYFALGELFELDGDTPVLHAAGQQWPVASS